MLARVPPLPAGWSVIEGDVTSLPVAEGSVDAISASYLLHVLPDAHRRRAITEMARVLVPAGLVGVVVPALPGGVLRRPYRRALRGLERDSPTALGLRAIDAADEFAHAGLQPARGRYVRRGYPSLCLLARAPS